MHKIAWMGSGIINYLAKVLDQKSKKDEESVKIFLRTFLKVRHVGEDDYTYDPSFFEKLVQLVNDTITHLLYEIHSYNHIKTCKTQDHVTQLYSCVDLLQYLYILNDSWYQWFDIYESHQLLEKGAFRNKSLEEMITKYKRSDLKRFILTSESIQRCPALVSTELRHYIYKSFNSFKTDENNTRRYKVSRHHVLEDMEEIFDNKNSIKKKWQFEFLDENGIGPGPTKEVYSIASNEFHKKSLNIWSTENQEQNQTEFVYAPNGLHPRPSSLEVDENIIKKFSLLGKLSVKSLLDGHLLDIPLNVKFYERLFRPEDRLLKKPIYDVPNVLPMTATTIRQLLSFKRKKERINSDESLTQEEKDDKVLNLMYDDGCPFDDVMIDFTLPGYPDVEMKEGGKDIMLSSHNVEEYLECLASLVIGNGIRKQSEAFLDGFNQVMPLKIGYLLPEDFESLFCGEKCEEWSIEYLKSYCEFEEGYTKDSMPVRYLLEVLSSFDASEQRLFLQFVTSRPRLPRGGLSHMQPRLTISRRPTDTGTEDKYLPSAATCFNKIHLPEYKSVDVTRENLMYAVKEGSNSFQLC